MAETLTIGGVDRTANLHRDSLRIEQAAGEFTAVCSFKLDDLDSTLNIQTRDAVTVTDNGTTLFAGEVVDIDDELLSLALAGRRICIRCQDYNILVEEAVIDGEEAYSATADSAIIADLFANYRADIDATTYVSTLDASMTISFQDVSLRQALSDICSRTGGRWYVDEAKALHYFTAEGDVRYYVEFNGTTTKIVVSDNATIQDLPLADLTVETWVNSNDPTSYQNLIMKFAVGPGWLLRFENNGKIFAIVFYATTNPYVRSAASYADGSWHHVAFTLDAAAKQIRLYVDGGLVDTSANGVGAYQSDIGVDLGIGARTSGLFGLDGGISWSRISNNIRYTDTFTPTARCAPPAVDGNTVEQWIFQDGAGTTLEAEVSSPANDGTITDGAWKKDTGCGGNVCAWWLSDSPDDVSSFPYQNIKKRLLASTIVNRFLVVGKELRDWYEDAVSVAAYGERPAVVTDNRITTQAGLDARGAALLDKWANPRVAYDVVTRKVGLRAGMDVRLICGAWGIDETLTVRRLTITWRGGNRFYALEIGEGIATALTTGRVWLERLGQTEGAISSISDTVFDTDAPAAPNPLGAGNVTTGTDLDADGHQIVYAEITWSAVADTDLDHYELQLSTQNDFTSDVMSRNHPAGGNRHERFVGILGNTTYYVRVRATDWVGNDSAWDYGGGAPYSFTSAADTTAPAQVAGLVAAASRTLIGVNWTANTEADLKHYEIQRAPDVAGAPGAWATIALARLNFYIDQDFTDGEIAAQDTFWYQVRAVDTSDNEGDWAAETSAALSQIASDHIAALSITTAKLAAGAVTAEKITVAELSAINADLGTITAGTVTGATIRTAAVGARVVLDSTDGLQLYNATPILCAQLDVDGSGQIGASGGAVPPLTWNALGQFNRIQANQLQIGEFLFNQTDGLLLLGPNCEITPTTWVSLRKQAATMSGAFHQTQGMWLGTRGQIVEVATANLIINPSAETNVTGWLGVTCTISQSSTQAFVGDYSIKGVVTAAAGYIVYHEGGGAGKTAVLPANAYTLTGWVYAEVAGDSVNWGWSEYNGAAHVGNYSTVYTLKQGWQQLTHTATTQGATDGMRPIMYNLNDTMVYYLDAVQLEKLAYATTYCDGDQGYGYSWTGAVHASTSLRAVTEINLDAHTHLIDENATLSFRVVCQAAYDADEIWPVATSAFMHAAKDTGLEAIAIYFNPADDKIYAVILDGVDTISLTSAAQTFVAKDWLDIVVTLDFDSDEYKLYVNGQLEDTDVNTCTPPILEQWNIGSNYLGANQSGAAFCEVAVFDNVLTAAQVAQIFELQQPLIDTGSVESPGIYILDGKFRIASSSTGNRIEIVGDEIAGYDSGGTKQFYLQASDGKAYAGAGAVYLDNLGININMDVGGGLIQFIKTGTQRGRIYGDTSGAIPQIWIEAGDAPAANSSRLMLYAKSPASVQTGIRIASSGGETPTVAFRIDGSSHVILDTDWMEFQTGVISGLKPDADEAGYVGSATVGWYEMNSKQFNDIGCIPFCNRIARVAGRPSVVGDSIRSPDTDTCLEALRRIRAMADGEKALCGEPKVDYSTLPEIVYNPAFDEDGNYVKDRAELTALIGVLIGAIRELDGKIN